MLVGHIRKKKKKYRELVTGLTFLIQISLTIMNLLIVFKKKKRVSTRVIKVKSIIVKYS